MPPLLIDTLLAEAARPQRATLRLAMLCAGLAAVAAVTLLALSGWFLAGAAIAGLSGMAAVQAFNYLLPSAAIRGLAITRTATRYGERLLGHKAALLTLAGLRPRLFARLAAARPAEALETSTGDLAARLGNDVDALEDSVIRRATLPAALASATVALVAGLAMGHLPVLALALGMVAMRLAARRMATRQLAEPLAASAEALARMKRDYADRAAPCADIAVYGLAPRIAALTADAATDYDAARLATVRAEARIGAVQTLLAVTTVAAMIALSPAGAPLLALGALAALGGLESWATLAQSDTQAPRVNLARHRLASLAQPAPPPKGPAIKGETLAIAGTSFARGGRLRIAGRSGAGKTRLVETLAGLRDDAPQAMAIDGIPLTAIAPESRRPLFALAAQDAPLIAGSIADNLRLAAPGLDEARMWDALRVACADDVVRALPEGLDQWLGGDGARLSGGQRRRIALARALLADRPWLVLDEPSEGLDAETEAPLVARLRDWLDTSGSGLILVSHRPAMAALAEQTVPLG